jgi:hypothetical protein
MSNVPAGNSKRMPNQNFRIRPIVLDGQVCDGIWTDGTFAWIGSVQWYTLVSGQSRQLVLPLTDAGGSYIAAPHDWRALVVEALDD